MKKKPEPLKILVADDDCSVVRLVEKALKPLGAEVICALDGEEALEKFLVEQPDVVVLDVIMPKLSGWEITKYIRDRHQYDDVKILILTGIGPRLNDATSPLFGANDFLDKPFSFHGLTERVRNLIH